MYPPALPVNFDHGTQLAFVDRCGVRVTERQHQCCDRSVVARQNDAQMPRVCVVCVCCNVAWLGVLCLFVTRHRCVMFRRVCALLWCALDALKLCGRCLCVVHVR